MRWLVLVPLINIGIWLIVAIVYLFKSDKNSYKGLPLDIDTYMPDGEQYKDKVGTPRDADYRPDIADQLDGRLTNVLKNPMKGIL